MSDTTAPSKGKVNHPWKFFRVGGFDQVKLDTGADLVALEQLDQKLWVALSCPTKGLEFDSKTLELIDTDKDGRVRVPEIVAAVKWAAANLKNVDELTSGSESLPLQAINDSTEEGKQLLASAQHILINLGKPDSPSISIADTTDTTRIFAQTKFNGDGIVPPDSADDEGTKAVINDIISCVGSETDRIGAPGVSQAKVDQFFADLQAYSDWWKQAEDSAPTALPLGNATPSAAETLNAVRAKVDDYFTRCRLAEFDGRAVAVLNRSQEDLAALTSKDLSASGAEVAPFPLAKVEAGRPLPLKEGVNPAWAEALGKLEAEVITPLLGPGRTGLTADEWAALCAKFGPYREWLAKTAGPSVEKLGLSRVREILTGDAKATVTALIAKDKALEPQAQAIAAVDGLVRYYRDLYRLLNNFVSFTDFYSPDRKAVFQAGTLYLDGRSCELCVRVDDAAKHGALASLSKTYLAYCDCNRRGGTDKMTIAAAFTDGDSDNLMVGRNGVFYDRNGNDWDATITKIVEHPIGIRQAILLPYKRLGRFLGEQIQKMAVAKEKAAIGKAETQIVATAAKAEAGKPAAAAAPPSPFDAAKFAGIFAAIGLALGAIGTAIASLVTGFLRLAWWQMPLAILGIMAVISGPSVVIAWLKLRQRNLGPILDASGWAVNARVKVNIPFGRSLTGTAKLPPGASRTLQDPYQDKSARGKLWFWGILVLIVAAVVTYYVLKTYVLAP